VRKGTRFTAWKMKPTRSRRKAVSRRADSRVMSSPATITCPVVADRSPPAIDSSVVLPDPEGPSRVTTSSEATLSSTFSRAINSAPPTS
jgi:hypothetical protein